MLNLPLVSFIVTSYNYEKFILKTLESIKNQSYKNIEIIIVDDLSEDNSVNVIKKFIEENQDLPITLVENSENIGQLGSILKGLKLAKGQFVSFIDSDDVLMEDFAKVHIQVHLQTSVAFTSCSITEIGESDEVHTFNSISSGICSNFKDLYNNETPEFKILGNKRFGGWYWSPNSSAMYRKSTIEILETYQSISKWKICPDKFIMNYANLVGGSALIKSPLLGYRRHKNNAGNNFLVTGNKKLTSDETTANNIQNNLKIRPETIKFLWQNQDRLGKRNTVTLISTAVLSYIL